MKLKLLLVFISITFFAGAQSTKRIKVMQYNLLNYENFTSFCTTSNNSSSTKETSLTAIVRNTEADIFIFNEMNNSPATLQKLFDAVFANLEKPYYYAPYSSNGSSLVNGIYYDTALFAIAEQDMIRRDVQNQNLTRGIDFIKFYYKDPNLKTGSDTLFFNVLAAHLKAGSTSSDEDRRADETQAVMSYLNLRNQNENTLFAGDLNVKTSTEEAFINLLDHPNAGIEFVDPADALGNWNNNASFSAVHTQSTSTSGGCKSGGGMDDRFDFILCNNNILQGNLKMTYVEDSYTALGQDGNRFNGSILAPVNSAVSLGIANALSTVSDHLPVLAEFDLEEIDPVGVASRDKNQTQVYFSQAGLNIQSNAINEIESLSILNMHGVEVWKTNAIANQIGVDLAVGFYLIKVDYRNDRSTITKALKINF